MQIVKTMNIEQIKQVLEGAPEGATHIDMDGDYWDELYPCDNSQQYDLQSAGWIENHGFRSLDDFRTILAQHEEIERLRGERDSVCHLNDSLSLENERLRSELAEVWAIPVCVQESSPEAEDVQEIKDKLSLAIKEQSK